MGITVAGVSRARGFSSRLGEATPDIARASLARDRFRDLQEHAESLPDRARVGFDSVAMAVLPLEDLDAALTICTGVTVLVFGVAFFCRVSAQLARPVGHAREAPAEQRH